jgi:hypothetical protein
MNYASFEKVPYKTPFEADKTKYRVESSGAFDGKSYLIEKSTNKIVYTLDCQKDAEFLEKFGRGWHKGN